MLFALKLEILDDSTGKYPLVWVIIDKYLFIYKVKYWQNLQKYAPQFIFSLVSMLFSLKVEILDASTENCP